MVDTTPTCPAGWSVSTALSTHISLWYRDDGRSLLVRSTEPATMSVDPGAVDTWTVKGLAGYGPAYPIFAEEVTRAEAITTAEMVMETITRGDTPSPVRHSNQPEPAEASTSDPGAEPTDNPDQASLSTFGVDADDE
ncbi:hypothetical protein [Halonotius roseus]|uniref:Uncharacterized protein n=1 Tax=Halonotius roseus TaxID=2511997 RepID=A0A544QPR7_9EURY|nr:hypothetical protein [Halonotius roseus]TQQ81437.1 hypothetical protein EWF95_00365 [Halonotius roseus]